MPRSIFLTISLLTICISVKAQKYAYHHPTWAEIDTAIKVRSLRANTDEWTDLERVCDYNLLLQKYLHDTSGIDVDLVRINKDSVCIYYQCDGEEVYVNPARYLCLSADNILLHLYRFHYSDHPVKEYQHYDKFYNEKGWFISQKHPDSVLVFQYYLDGKENGRHAEFYPDGQIAVDGQYRVDSIGLIKSAQAQINSYTLEELTHISDGSDSKKSGTWLYYDRAGNVIRREEY